MQLTKHTDFTFRALIYLASMTQDLTNIQRIADDYSLSKSHLMKIINKLVQHGWVEAVRGKNGGIRLAVAPESIGLKEVILLMEPNLEPVNCNEPPCIICDSCQLRGILQHARDRYLDSLSDYTLADLLNDNTVQVIQIQASSY